MNIVTAGKIVCCALLMWGQAAPQGTVFPAKVRHSADTLSPQVHIDIALLKSSFREFPLAQKVIEPAAYLTQVRSEIGADPSLKDNKTLQTVIAALEEAFRSAEAGHRAYFNALEETSEQRQQDLIRKSFGAWEGIDKALKGILGDLSAPALKQLRPQYQPLWGMAYSLAARAAYYLGSMVPEARRQKEYIKKAFELIEKARQVPDYELDAESRIAFGNISNYLLQSYLLDQKEPFFPDAVSAARAAIRSFQDAQARFTEIKGTIRPVLEKDLYEGVAAAIHRFSSAIESRYEMGSIELEDAFAEAQQYIEWFDTIPEEKRSSETRRLLSIARYRVVWLWGATIYERAENTRDAKKRRALFRASRAKYAEVTDFLPPMIRENTPGAEDSGKFRLRATFALLQSYIRILQIDLAFDEPLEVIERDYQDVIEQFLGYANLDPTPLPKSLLVEWTNKYVDILLLTCRRIVAQVKRGQHIPRESLDSFLPKSLFGHLTEPARNDLYQRFLVRLMENPQDVSASFALEYALFQHARLSGKEPLLSQAIALYEKALAFKFGEQLAPEQQAEINILLASLELRSMPEQTTAGKILVNTASRIKEALLVGADSLDDKLAGIMREHYRIDATMVRKLLRELLAEKKKKLRELFIAYLVRQQSTLPAEIKKALQEVAVGNPQLFTDSVMRKHAAQLALSVPLSPLPQRQPPDRKKEPAAAQRALEGVLRKFKAGKKELFPKVREQIWALAQEVNATGDEQTREYLISTLMRGNLVAGSAKLAGCAVEAAFALSPADGLEMLNNLATNTAMSQGIRNDVKFDVSYRLLKSIKELFEQSKKHAEEMMAEIESLNLEQESADIKLKKLIGRWNKHKQHFQYEYDKVLQANKMAGLEPNMKWQEQIDARMQEAIQSMQEKVAQAREARRLAAEKARDDKIKNITDQANQLQAAIEIRTAKLMIEPSPDAIFIRIREIHDFLNSKPSLSVPSEIENADSVKEALRDLSETWEGVAQRLREKSNAAAQDKRIALEKEIKISGNRFVVIVDIGEKSGGERFECLTIKALAPAEKMETAEEEEFRTILSYYFKKNIDIELGYDNYSEKNDPEPWVEKTEAIVIAEFEHEKYSLGKLSPDTPPMGIEQAI